MILLICFYDHVILLRTSTLFSFLFSLFFTILIVLISMNELSTHSHQCSRHNSSTPSRWFRSIAPRTHHDLFWPVSTPKSKSCDRSTTTTLLRLSRLRFSRTEPWNLFTQILENIHTFADRLGILQWRRFVPISEAICRWTWGDVGGKSFGTIWTGAVCLASIQFDSSRSQACEYFTPLSVAPFAAR